ncbi:TetR/AcrR family transcriptional regulator [Streptomyces durbertensis]|uniref:TetR/AcrR family transcriptional regulator n=2 Tax=Streptomyces durbertensis TaxID=2448886 RepID=A0ABR6EEJ8_9ACTN|nr:TetR/AcrR family transcriptional regulator [Streptomyces durbertensis]
MLDAARRLFVERGWAAATVADIAKAAEVGVQTVYFTFGDKRALLRELLDTAVAGDSDPVATLDRPWARAVLAEPDPAAQLARQAAGAREIMERAAPVLEVVRGAAASDEQMAELWRLNREQRHTVQLSFARALAGKVAGPLREGRDPGAVADVATVLLGPETYGPLVTEAGWPPPRWERWAADSLVRQFLP